MAWAHIEDPLFHSAKKKKKKTFSFFYSKPNLPITSYYNNFFFPCLEKRERVNKKIWGKVFHKQHCLCILDLHYSIVYNFMKNRASFFPFFFSSVLSILHFYEFYIIGQMCSYFLVDACKTFFFFFTVHSINQLIPPIILLKEKRRDLWSSSLGH